MQTDIIKIGPSQNASPKLCPATDSLTGVKCRATSVAKKMESFQYPLHRICSNGEKLYTKYFVSAGS